VLAADRRLRRRDEFTSAIRTGRRAGRGGVVIHLAVPPAVPVEAPAVDTAAPIDRRVARAGFIVPKAVGTAVVRNRVRRRLRHLVRDRLDRLPAGADLVIRVLPEATGRTYGQLGTDLDAAVVAAQSAGRATARSGDRSGTRSAARSGGRKGAGG
jgi:ribonuclease P protein component